MPCGGSGVPAALPSGRAHNGTLYDLQQNTVPQISHQVHHQVWLLSTGLCGYYPPRRPRLTSHSSISRPIRAVDALIILPELATEISNKTFTIVFSEPFAREQNNLTKWPSWRMVCGQRECKGNLE